MTTIFALIVAGIHVYIFLLESVLWGKPRTNKVFGIGPEESRVNKMFAFNQGFYNLFLSIAIVLGIGMQYAGREEAIMLTDYGVASVMAAGLVLVLSSGKLWRASLIQIGPAALYLAFRLAGI